MRNGTVGGVEEAARAQRELQAGAPLEGRVEKLVTASPAGARLTAVARKRLGKRAVLTPWAVAAPLRRVTSMAAPTHGLTGQRVALPGRGETWVVDTGAPAAHPDAPVLVLLHGMIANAELNWGLHLDELRAQYRVVMLDQRWHGRGIRSPQFSLEDCADDVSALANVLGIEAYIVVGYSMGTAVAQLCWRRHRGEVAGIILGAGQTRWRVHRGEQALYPLVSTAAALAGSGWIRRAAAVRRAASGYVRGSSGRAWAARQVLESSPQSYAGVLAALGEFDSRSWISEVDVPACVIVTSHDWAVPPTRQRELASMIPGCHTIEVDGGHASVGVAPRRFSRALLEACAHVTTAQPS